MLSFLWLFQVGEFDKLLSVSAWKRNLPSPKIRGEVTDWATSASTKCAVLDCLRDPAAWATRLPVKSRPPFSDIPLGASGRGRFIDSRTRSALLAAGHVSSMIGGLFVYNHKGEVLISRIYRDDVR